MQIRTALAADVPVLRRVFRSASLSNDGDREVLLANPDALQLGASGVAEGRTRVALDPDGEIVGFITGLPLEGSIIELEDLFVNPARMRQGVARELVADMVETAQRNGVTRIQVTANPHADAFYCALGFVHLHETTTEFGPGARMELAVWRTSPARLGG